MHGFHCFGRIRARSHHQSGSRKNSICSRYLTWLVPPASLEDIIEGNESVQDMLDLVIKKELLLESKLKQVLDSIPNTCKADSRLVFWSLSLCPLINLPVKPLLFGQIPIRNIFLAMGCPICS